MSSLIIGSFSKNCSIVRSLVNVPCRYLCSKNQLPLHRFETFDIVIAGGGLVGCALACALGSSGVLKDKRILLLDSNNKTEYSIAPNKYSNRVCAISPGSKALFEKIGAWEKMCNIRLKEVKKLQIWDSCSDASIAFQYPDMMRSVAYIVENDVMLNAFNACLGDLQDRIQILRGLKAKAYNLPSSQNYGHEHVTVMLDSGEKLQAKLLIGADGINSVVRQAMGVKYFNFNYNQKGIVATLKLAEPTENVVAWQRFLPSGPIALLPIADDLFSLVWTVSLPMCEKLLRMSDEEFVDALNSFLWSEGYKNSFVDSAVSVLSSMLPGKDGVKQLPPSILSVEPGSRAAFPLALGHAAEYITPRVALIGDAAHRVHPLAGQGVNLGFGDIQCLLACLENSVFSGNEIGCMDALQDYETQRQRHVIPSMIAIDALKRVYGTDFAPIVLLRSLGVTFLDSVDWLKDRMIEHASS